MVDVNDLESSSNPDLKFIIASKQVIPLRRDPIRDIWYDPYGTIFALSEGMSVMDEPPACGVGPFEFPRSASVTLQCKVHDFLYSSKAYQVFHSRKDADGVLDNLIAQNKKWVWLTAGFGALVRIFGSHFWDVKATNVKL